MILAHKTHISRFISIFLICFVLLLFLVMVLSFWSTGYKEGTNLSPQSRMFYGILSTIHFSLEKWNSWIGCGFMGNIAHLLSLITTNLILSLAVYFIIVLWKLLKTAKNRIKYGEHKDN